MAKYIPCDGPDCPNAPTVIMTFITEGRTVYYCDEHYAGLIIEMAAFMAGDDEEPLLTDEALAELGNGVEDESESWRLPVTGYGEEEGPADWPAEEPEAEPEMEPK